MKKFLGKLNKLSDKFYIKIRGCLKDFLKAEIRDFIKRLKKSHSTKPLPCFRMCGVHIHNETIKFFRESF